MGLSRCLGNGLRWSTSKGVGFQPGFASVSKRPKSNVQPPNYVRLFSRVEVNPQLSGLEARTPDASWKHAPLLKKSLRICNDPQ